ncbi:Uu.00g122850.m01.CDS01 [Anthostomella pinea]|uniref:Uu.00g122850.m01.CDS01 n=1 Tax=Anthostomella pinea TaxID=933095 RepID=A0AAI8YHG6_9PEZI|nr:Uu.00g122850.m01.CDS01 [Anthostomella pinea]
MSSSRKLTILITGCSPGGTGAALAVTFHAAGHHVYATARNPSKLSSLASQGIETLPLDVTSAASIASAVDVVTKSLSEKSTPTDAAVSGRLDMLINNAGGHYTTPLADASLDSAKALFDLNVWAQLAVTQAFLPLLLRSASSPTSSTASGPATPMIVNHTSVGSMTPMPFQGLYSASKAALARLSDSMRQELSCLGIRVVELKTAGVRTNFIRNSNTNNVEGRALKLPDGSLYEPARELVQGIMSQEQHAETGISAEQWAEGVVGDLMRRSPPPVIWRGENALLARVASVLPAWVFEGVLKRMMGMDEVEKIMRESRR